MKLSAEGPIVSPLGNTLQPKSGAEEKSKGLSEFKIFNTSSRFFVSFFLMSSNKASIISGVRPLLESISFLKFCTLPSSQRMFAVPIGPSPAAISGHIDKSNLLPSVLKK